jgi:hypothetical protein
MVTNSKWTSRIRGFALTYTARASVNENNENVEQRKPERDRML